MAIEINNLTLQGFDNKPRLTTSSAPSGGTPNTVTVKTTKVVEQENIVRLDDNNGKRVAAQQLNNPSQNPVGSSGNNSEEKLIQSLTEISTSIQAIQRKLEFRVDDDSGRTVITVRDLDTQEVIRQIPSEQLLDVSARIREIQLSKASDNTVEAQGVLFTSRT